MGEIQQPPGRWAELFAEAGVSSVAQLIVRTSRTLNGLLFCPAPAKAIMASRCCCRSPVGLGALMGASLTRGSEANPVLLRLRSLMALRTVLYLLPHQAS